MKKHLLHSPLQPNQIYHIYSRGNNRETLFKQAENYPYFLRLWQRHISPIAETYAYCLLPNHFHFCIHVRKLEALPLKYQWRDRSLSQPISNCLNAYTKAINKRFERSGSLFQERYKRGLITGKQELSQLIAYIHTNPQHHGACHDFRSYAYSSYQALLSSRPTHLKRTDLWDVFGQKVGFADFHEEPQHWLHLVKGKGELA
ncbi:MAG: transposase [Bacteroidota bacterium]